MEFLGKEMLSSAGTLSPENITSPESSFPIVAVAAAYGFQGFLSIFLNGVSMFVLSEDPSIMEEAEVIFIRALSAQDLVLGAFMSTSYTFMVASPDSLTDSLACGALQGTNVILGGQAQNLLLMLTLDRYLRITRPLRYIRWINPTRARIVVAVSFAVPIFFCACAALPQSLFDALRDNCGYPFPLNRVILTIPGSCVVLLVISTLANAKIILVVRKQYTRISDAAKLQTTLEPNTYQRAGVIKGALTILTLNVVSYTVWLSWVLECLIALKHQGTLSQMQAVRISLIWQMTTWCNPIIFFITNRSYRQIIKKKILGCKN